MSIGQLIFLKNATQLGTYKSSLNLILWCSPRLAHADPASFSNFKYFLLSVFNYNSTTGLSHEASNLQLFSFGLNPNLSYFCAPLREIQWSGERIGSSVG
jgi:hypothetical protein